MSPILDVQQRYRELGRLRMGEVEGRRPVRRETWRLTSPSKPLLEEAAGIFGGSVGTWKDAPTEGDQYELATQVSELQVLVPPQDIDSNQWYELWTGGGCKRRCDGVTDFLSGRACPCAQKEERECKPTTHLLVMLPQIGDIGTWRLVTHGWNAASELPTTVHLLASIVGRGAWPEATLTIAKRTSKTNGETHHYVVPELRLPFGLQKLIESRTGLEITSGERGYMPIPGERPMLPGDPAFRDERDAGWGETAALPGGSGEQERDPDPPASPADGDLSEEVSESKTSPGETSEGGMVSEESSERAASLPHEIPPEDEPATAEQWARAEALGISGNTALRQVRAAIRKGELEGEPPANQSAISRDQLAHVILQKVPA